MSELRCFVCERALPNPDEGGNQPSGGLAFMSSGHYGSTEFDPMDGSFLEINVCDSCLVEAREGGLVRRGDYHPVVVRKPRYSDWRTTQNTENT